MAETVKGVAFAGWQSEAGVWGVNRASTAELDLEAGLDARAAVNLSSLRPFASATAIGNVTYVGSAALLRLQARAHGQPPASITLDGVRFDAATEATALQISNLATREDPESAREAIAARCRRIGAVIQAWLLAEAHDGAGSDADLGALLNPAVEVEPGAARVRLGGASFGWAESRSLRSGSPNVCSSLHAGPAGVPHGDRLDRIEAAIDKVDQAALVAPVAASRLPSLPPLSVEVTLAQF